MQLCSNNFQTVYECDLEWDGKIEKVVPLSEGSSSITRGMPYACRLIRTLVLNETLRVWGR